MRHLVQSRPAEPAIALENTDPPKRSADTAVVRVEAFSLNRADVLYMQVPEARWRIGIDCAGTVVDQAADGRGPAEGTRVVVHLPEGGAGAEQIAVPWQRLAPVPNAVDSATAAALPLAGLVALRLVRAAGDLRGRRVLVTGASGGVGHLLVQLARARGTEVHAMVRDNEPKSHLVDAGARIHSADAVPGTRFDVIFESVGGDTAGRAVSALAPGGHVIWFGQASGDPITLDFFSFLASGQGFSLTHFVYSDHEADGQDDLAELVQLAAAGTLVPHIGSIEDWVHTEAALDRISRGVQPGKAVLTIGAGQ